MKKGLSILLALVMVLSVFAVIPVGVSAKEMNMAESAAAGIANNGIGGINININAYPYTDGGWGATGGDPYGGGGCTWFVGSRVMQLTGKGSCISKNPSSWYFDYGPSLGFNRGSTPHAPAVICYSGHVAILEKIEGNTAYISEGGINQYKHDGNWQKWASGNSYCAIHRIEVGEIANWCGYRSDFLGYLYLGSSNNPEGAYDYAEGGVGTVYIAGWAFDRDNTNQSLSIHVYIGGEAGEAGAEGHGNIVANTKRQDVDDVYHVGTNHGFASTISTAKTGTQKVYVYAINIGDGRNTLLGEKTVDIKPKDPEGAFDKAEGGVGTVSIVGWAFDWNNTNQPLAIHVYIGGEAGEAGAEGHSDIVANTRRQDVDNVYHVGINHGFSTTIPTAKTGRQKVCVYAINLGDGSNVLLGTKTVTITPDTEKPIISDQYITMLTSDSYRVCVKPNDNVGIKSVKIGTSATVDATDEIINNASFDGTDTYYLDINRFDYAQTNTRYHNRIYVYDYAGNCVESFLDAYFSNGEMILGDADGDGEISAIDMAQIMRYVAHIDTGVDEEVLMNADVDGNGELEIVDATYIQRYLSRMETPYAIGEAI
ncbi:dockerin type I domain-containing protein [Ruminococcus difficilis]|uniref:Dockerin type I repeat-containing protein n=1 Tax=Ruminococcus difficilis TaxID=2763069 RepID=A0A934TZ97_9FIRM|nr:dockerin type I repeat-containing protein [Ruminococcus difficilis]